MDAEVVRQLIQRRLQDGRLPHGRVLALPVRRGGGEMCDGCGTSITTDQMGRSALVVEDWSTIHLHAECFAIWDSREARVVSSGLRRATRLVNDMNDRASIELVVTTEALDKAITLLLKFDPETLYQDTMHAFIHERDQRKLGSSARAIVLARRRVDDLPPGVRAALRER